MDEDYYKKYLRKYVAVGIEHFTDPLKVFWIYGTLLEVSRVGVIVSTRNGFRKIPFDEIQSFHLV